MYKVYRNGNRSLRQTFETYEEARKAVRNLIRARTRKQGIVANRVFEWSHPTLSDFGFSIKRV